MQYVLVHAIDADLAAAVGGDDEAQSSCEAWVDETVRRHINLHGSRLRPVSDATTVRVRNDELFVTDGPFVETKEQVAGYDLLECHDIEEAVQWAAKHPSARMGAIEVRAVADEQAPEGLPDPAPGKVRYIMLVCTDPDVDPGEVAHARPIDEWVEENDRRRVRRFGTPLQEPDKARTVRARDGRTMVTDGPFAETKEQIAGFDVLDCTDLDEAIEVARDHPMARFGTLEIRPFWPFGEP
jgi:hypothetical protein